MKLEDYLKGNDSFKNKEKKLNEIISSLDDKSRDLYNEIYDELKIESNVDEYYDKIDELDSALDRISKALEYLDLSEQTVDSSKSTKLLLKGLACLIIFCITFPIAPLLSAVLLFYMLTRLKFEASQLEDSKNTHNKFDDRQLIVIRNTLENSKTMLRNKKRLLESRERNKNIVYNSYNFDMYNYYGEDNYMKLMLK